jgi:hypothetical protein
MGSRLRRFGSALRDDDRLTSPVVVVPTTLEQAISDEPNVWTIAAQQRIRSRLQLELTAAFRGIGITSTVGRELQFADETQGASDENETR